MKQFDDAIELLKGMVAIPSFSREEKNLADFLFEQWKNKGQQPQRIENNIWLVHPIFDSNKPTVLLNSHIDTVKPVSGWTKNPFMPTMDGEKLFGLGSNDAGASVVSLYEAFTILCEHKLNYNLIFLASAEEEISGKNGIKLVLSEAKLPDFAFGIVGEPTGMQPAIAGKGLMVLDCISYGVSGHAARNEGVNAITKAMDDIRWFSNYQFPKQTTLLGPVKMTVTIIQAGTQHNVIPDQCHFTVDVRTNECYTNEEIFNTIRQHVQCEVKPRRMELGSSFISPTHPFVANAIQMGKTPYGSPTLSDQVFMKFPTVKMGPGESERSHTADEYIFLSEIREAIETYVQLLDNLCIENTTLI